MQQKSVLLYETCAPLTVSCCCLLLLAPTAAAWSATASPCHVISWNRSRACRHSPRELHGEPGHSCAPSVPTCPSGRALALVQRTRRSAPDLQSATSTRQSRVASRPPLSFRALGVPTAVYLARQCSREPSVDRVDVCRIRPSLVATAKQQTDRADRRDSRQASGFSLVPTAKKRKTHEKKMGWGRAGALFVEVMGVVCEIGAQGNRRVSLPCARPPAHTPKMTHHHHRHQLQLHLYVSRRRAAAAQLAVY